jgi:hypothetical protein
MSDELASFLEDSTESTGEAPVTEVVTDTPAEPTPEPNQEPEAKDESSPPELEKQSGTVPIAALLDEREKRQQYQRELEALRATKPPEPQVRIPDVLDDQEGFVKHFQSELKNATTAIRIEMSQDLLRMQHEDYDAMEANFVAMANENPSLAQQMVESSNPAKFAYDTAKKAEKLARMENIDEWEAQKTAEIEAKVRAQIEAELTGKIKGHADKVSSLSPSISTVAAAGGNSRVPETVPDVLLTKFNR